MNKLIYCLIIHGIITTIQLKRQKIVSRSNTFNTRLMKNSEKHTKKTYKKINMIEPDEKKHNKTFISPIYSNKKIIMLLK